MSERDDYLECLHRVEEAERTAMLIPSIANLNRLVALIEEAKALYESIPMPHRPVPIGRIPIANGLTPRGEVKRRDKHSDWNPMSFRGQSN